MLNTLLKLKKIFTRRGYNRRRRTKKRWIVSKINFRYLKKFFSYVNLGSRLKGEQHIQQYFAIKEPALRQYIGSN